VFGDRSNRPLVAGSTIGRHFEAGIRAEVAVNVMTLVQ